MHGTSRKVNFAKFQKAPVSLEKSVHSSLCEYIRWKYPTLIFNTDLSGIRLTQGQAIQVKKLRSSNGFPDIVIYEARGGYFGLFLELKKEDQTPYRKDGSLKSDEHIHEQDQMHQRLNSKYYFAKFSIGLDHAIKILDWYMSQPETFMPSLKHSDN